MSILKKAFDNLSNKPFILDEKSEKILNDETQPIPKRFKILAKFVENGDPEAIKPYFVEKYAAIYKIFLDSLQQFDQEMKLKNNPNKFIPTSEVISLTHIMLGLFKYAHAIIQKKWQQRSLVHHIECFLTPDNVFNVRLEGFELLLNFVDIMQENADEKVLDLIMAVLDLKLFADPKVKLPGFPYRVIDEKDRVKIQKTDKVITDQEQIVMITRFFTFIRQGDGSSFNFWWKFFKTRLATLLYPHECQSLELLNKLDDMGFRQPYTCPHSIHLLVLNLILDSLEMKKKADVIYASDKDIYLMLLIFRQSFLLPPQYFEYILKMLKPYHTWVCGDQQQQQSSISIYSWPEIMEKKSKYLLPCFH